jgi:hypothetical protein
VNRSLAIGLRRKATSSVIYMFIANIVLTLARGARLWMGILYRWPIFTCIAQVRVSFLGLNHIVGLTSTITI